MSLKNFVKTVICRLGIIWSHIGFAFVGNKTVDIKNIPIIINNYNRLSYMKELISSLTERGYHNIHIIDNNSSYPPLLEYYEHCPYKVFRLEENVGYLALWKTGIYKSFRNSYYVYTDSDMKIDEGCPDDFMSKFIDVLNHFPMAQKAGFGIRIDDLPDHFKNKAMVIAHESQFWAKPVAEDVYEAQIDTTFALYRPFCKGKADRNQKTYRTGGKYVIQHLPWYVDSSNLSEEERYYVDTITQSTHWSQQA